MDPEFREEKSQVSKRDAKPAEQQPRTPRRSLLADWTNALLSIGLGESMLRVGTAILSLVLIIAAIWLLGVFNEQVPQVLQTRPALAAGPTATPGVDPSLLPPPTDSALPGIFRLAEPHTNIPSRPEAGDRQIHGSGWRFGLRHRGKIWSRTPDRSVGKLQHSG